MLKSKRAIYLLIPANIIIWGYFIFQMFSGIDTANVTSASKVKQEKPSNSITDSAYYEPKFNYLDPFLKSTADKKTSSYNYQESNREKQTTRHSTTEENSSKKNLPDLNYLGLVKNQKNGKTCALISLNGQPIIARKHEIVEGYKIVSLSKDSVILMNGKKPIVLRK